MKVTLRNKKTGRTSVKAFVTSVEVNEETITVKFDRRVYSTITSVRMQASDWEVVKVEELKGARQ